MQHPRPEGRFRQLGCQSSHFDAQDRDHYGDRVFGGTHWYVHPSVTGWNTDDFDCGDYEFEPTHWRPKSLAPTAPVEASGSEREHGPKCWGKTSFSDEMAHCYCGSTDLRPQPSGETRKALDRLKMAAHVYEDDEMAADCETLEAILFARLLALGGQQGDA